MDPVEETSQSSVFHSLSDSGQKSGIYVLLFILSLIVVIGGVIIGRYLAVWSSGGLGSTQKSAAITTKSNIKVGVIYGSNDTKTFKDTAEGVDTVGGINGEGQYHLVRPGGDSQNVYMTSSVIDLSLFLNRKIKVWGQTQKAQSAGWLMDVGRVEVLQ